MFARVSRLVPVIAQHCAAFRSIPQHSARPRTCQPLRHHCCVLTLPCLSPSGPVAILYALVRTGSRLVRGGPQRSAAVRAVPHMTATQCPVLTHAVPGLSLGVSAAVSQCAPVFTPPAECHECRHNATRAPQRHTDCAHAPSQRPGIGRRRGTDSVWPSTAHKLWMPLPATAQCRKTP